MYGPVQDDRKGSFLQEIYQKVQGTNEPLIIGGDFNMIRYQHEKSSGNINRSIMDMFNGFIDDCALREIIRNDSKFTWTNKQEAPIRCVLDRILVTQSWENKYPQATLRSLLRVGSYHNPLILETDRDRLRPQIFKFETFWLQ